MDFAAKLASSVIGADVQKICNIVGDFMQGVSSVFTPSKGENHADVVAQLKELRDRLDRLQQPAKVFFVDDVVAWEHDLKRIFGRSLIVLQDIFHLMNRYRRISNQSHRLLVVMHILCCA
eukprot:scaffold679815_cov141-Prasinocladus_malaysianus.AAC.1